MTDTAICLRTRARHLESLPKAQAPVTLRLHEDRRLAPNCTLPQHSSYPSHSSEALRASVRPLRSLVDSRFQGGGKMAERKLRHRVIGAVALSGGLATAMLGLSAGIAAADQPPPPPCGGPAHPCPPPR